jgi:hypothetical protein
MYHEPGIKGRDSFQHGSFQHAVISRRIDGLHEKNDSWFVMAHDDTIPDEVCAAREDVVFDGPAKEMRRRFS